MKKLHIIIALLLISFSVKAQLKECFTLAPPPPDWIINPKLKTRGGQTNSYSPPFLLRIYVHIVRTSEGNGLSSAIINTILNNLNSSYSGTSIQFELKGVDFIDNDMFYYELDDDEIDELFNTNNHNDAINIYVLGSSTSFGAAGMAKSIPSTSLLIHKNYYNKSTLPHEMGHCLGLYHTHHGTVCRHQSPPCYEGGIPEFVDGSNAKNAGDFIEDTPADPLRWSYRSCGYTGGDLQDAHNQKYIPDPSLFMSYSSKSCRNKFTPLQIKRMHDFLDMNLSLQQTVIPDITSPDLICDQASYTIENLPANTSVQWSTNNSNLTLVSGQGTGTAVFHKNGNGECTVKANVANSSVKLNKKVWVGNFYFFKTVDRTDCLNSINIYNAPAIDSAYYVWIKDDKIVLEGINKNIYEYVNWEAKEGDFEIFRLKISIEKENCLVSSLNLFENYYKPTNEDCFGGRYAPPLTMYLISPNNDGINDALSFSNLSSEKLVIENHIVIYNSQGAIVYEGYSKNFDKNSFEGVGNVGSYAGVALPEGVYFYKTMGRCTTSGSIYLRR